MSAQLEDPAMRETAFWELESEIGSAASTDVTVLISARRETALSIARLIHRRSRRRDGPFVIVDCERLDAGLSSADAALGGTLVFQEVGALDAVLQTRLLGFLVPERLGRSNGASRDGTAGIRVIAITSERLFDRIGAGTFEADLFYRLNSIHLIVNAILEA